VKLFGLPRVCVNFDTNVSTDMKTGAVNAAAGSAYAEFGQTKVIVSV
jgi:ribonuclease PH